MCLSIYGFVYIFGSILTPLIPARVERRCTLMTAMFGIGFFLFLVGPSQLLGFQESLTMMIVGLFLRGCFFAPLSIPALPEMIAATEEKYSSLDKEISNNLNSGIFNACLQLGHILGPLFGASTYSAVGFELT